jgi:hypothetical protein
MGCRPVAVFITDVHDYEIKKGPVTGLKWPRRFQEIMVPRFHDKGTGWW